MAKKKPTPKTDANPPRTPQTTGTKAEPERLDACGPRGCTITKPSGKFKVEADPVWFDFRYSTAAQPCSTDRVTCPVQLFFKRGKPFLRFCRTKPSTKTWTAHTLEPGADKPKEHTRKKTDYQKGRAPGDPGYVVEVPTVESAQQLAAAACRCWAQSHKGYYETVERLVKDKKTKRFTKQRDQIWRGSFETCRIGGTPAPELGLGGPRRRRRRGKKR